MEIHGQFMLKEDIDLSEIWPPIIGTYSPIKSLVWDEIGLDCRMKYIQHPIQRLHIEVSIT